MFFNPRSVAIIGASRTPGKLGHAVLQNIIRYGYQGAVYPINPIADEILGLQCYPSPLQIPGPLDLAIFLVPGKAVARALEQCGEKGAKGAVVISAGFRERGTEGWQRERELVEIARRYGMRLLGPNCLGIIDTYTRLNATFASGMPKQGGIAFMSQSGALCTAVLDMALSSGVGFSRFVCMGNKADADELTFIESWADDPNTRVVMAYLEGIEDGPQFMRVAREASQKKPIIAIKSGTTSAGSRAVSMHTGTLAGSERAYEAAFQQSGIVRARSLQELFDYSLAFARQPLLANDRIAIVTNAGGPGIMATDACELAGLQLASLESETIAGLYKVLPEAANVLNPIDVLGDALADRYRLALQWVLNDPNVGGVVVIMAPQIMTEVEETARVVGQLSQGCAKPVLACFMGSQKVAPGIRILNEFGVPNYAIPERALDALAAMMHYRRWRERPAPEERTFEADWGKVRAVFGQVRSVGRIAMGGAEAAAILEAYGIPTPRTHLARTPKDAVCYAGEIGFPVALKIASPDILYKTDVGGVTVNVVNADGVRDAFELMTYRVGRYVPNAEIRGCLVQEMVSGGKKVIVSMTRDPHFGPVLKFELGGIYGEAFRDDSVRVAPLDPRGAREMIGEIQGRNLLRGVRGQQPSDLGALTDTLLRLSQLVTDFPEIVEFEISPLMVFDEGAGLTAIDMRLVLG